MFPRRVQVHLLVYRVQVLHRPRHPLADRVHQVLVRYHLLVQVLPRQVLAVRVLRAHPVLAHRAVFHLARRVPVQVLLHRQVQVVLHLRVRQVLVRCHQVRVPVLYPRVVVRVPVLCPRRVQVLVVLHLVQVSLGFQVVRVAVRVAVL